MGMGMGRVEEMAFLREQMNHALVPDSVLDLGIERAVILEMDAIVAHCDESMAIVCLVLPFTPRHAIAAHVHEITIRLVLVGQATWVPGEADLAPSSMMMRRWGDAEAGGSTFGRYMKASVERQQHRNTTAVPHLLIFCFGPKRRCVRDEFLDDAV